MSQTRRHPALRVESEVRIANAAARSREHLIRETHVRVGDHPPEPRTNTTDALCRALEDFHRAPRRISIHSGDI